MVGGAMSRGAMTGAAWRTAWPFAIAAVAAAAFGVSVVRAWPFTVDDTYITLRYSRNVAEGLGPTFNADGPRAEGYTTFLWMVALVLPHALGLDAVVAAKVLSVLASAATMVVAARWARSEALAAAPADSNGAERAAWAGATAATCLAAVPATAVHAVSGMETALFTLLLTSAFATAADLVRGGRHVAASATRLCLLGLLLGLTRPEGNLAALLILGTSAALIPRGARPGLVLRAALGWAVPVAGYELWRRAYYGLWFPLPFYVKLATPGLFPGLPDVLAWLRAPVLHFAVLILPALVRPARSLAPALVAMGALVAFFILPQHQMGYDHRYLAPLDPSLGVLAGVGLARMLGRVTATGAAGGAGVSMRVSRSLGNVIAAAALVFAAGLEAVDARAVIGGEADYGLGLEHAHAHLGRELLALDAANARLVISDAGAVPYLSRWWTLDLVGLNDAVIATTGKRDPAWVLGQRPDVVVFASPRTDRVEPWDWNPWEPALYDACVAAGFARVGLERFADDYWLWVMAIPGSEIGRRLARQMADAPR
jgi:arabinofuranosyltransferase